MKKVIVAFFVFALAACSSIKSIENPEKETDSVEGLTYFMPKKDFLVTITIASGKITTVALGTTSSYPDLSTQYVLRHGANIFGKNTLNVGITESGLLTSTKSITVSNVTDAFKNLATTAGNLESLKINGRVDSPCIDGTHSFVYKTPGSHQACGMNIKISQQEKLVNISSHFKESEEEHSGIFYRQNIPYLVTAVGNEFNVASVVFSPSESETHFLPVSKTFFSNNKADFAFVNGIPTKYDQETEGEAIALFKLPADVLGAYFTAIGSVFDSFKANDEKEASALTESLKLELAKKKYDACVSAIKAGDETLIKELSCK